MTLTHRQTDSARKAIQVTKLIQRLQDFINGDVDLSATRIKAIEILLRKALPDLKSIEHSGEVGIKEALKSYDDAELDERIRHYAARAGYELTPGGKATTH